jgi:hypothetical protein
MTMSSDEQLQRSGWRARRRDRARQERERTGDTPEKRAEAEQGGNAATVEDSAGRASLGLTINGQPFQG